MTDSMPMPTVAAAMLLVLLLLVGTAPAAAQPLRLERVSIAGAEMQLPRGWTRQQDDYSLILTENPRDDDSPALALIAVQVPAGQRLNPADVAELILRELNLPGQGIRARQVEERSQPGALYRLHQLEKRGQTGYLVSYTHTDTRAGTIVHMLFSAMEQRFIELGGPMLPLVVFGGVDASALTTTQQIAAEQAARAAPRSDDCGGQSLELCLAERWFSPGGEYAVPSSSEITDSYVQGCEQRTRAARNATELAAAQDWCNRAYQRASQIMAISHRTSMQILHNINGGWCYRGESGCY